MQKIDVVYILGRGSCWNDNELRYSLRSISKYFPAAGRVFLIGEKPEWVQGVIHIPAPDKFDNKVLNARVKYTIAAEDPRVSKDFVLMNDDIFFLKTVNDIPNYSRGKMAEMIERHPTHNGYYYHTLKDTYRRLDAMGIPDAIDFEVHCPIIFNKEKLLSVMGMIGTAKPYSIRSAYGNLMRLEPKHTRDFKAANMMEFALQHMNPFSGFLSINDAVVADEGFRDWMHTRYHRISKYEIDERGLGILPGRPIYARRYSARKSFVYGKNKYQPGDIITSPDIETIKNTPKLADCWMWR